MDAKELRIGNLYDNHGKIETVSPSTIEEVWNSERKWCKPIPLTEEWFLKFGFDKRLESAIDCQFKKGAFEIYNDSNGFSIEIDWSFKQIKYIHQLQNLYFALTGEELKINQ